MSNSFPSPKHEAALKGLAVTAVSHTYRTTGLDERPVLSEVQFALAAGEFLLLRGVSGSGKTTLLNILAGLLTPTSGQVVINGQPLYALDEAARDRFRRTHIGYIFQSHHLLPMLKAWENVALPLAFAGQGGQKQRALALLAEVGLAEWAAHRPTQLSMGQRQRVAVARALAVQPRLILADEPTASLDTEAAEQVLDLLQQLCRASQTALVVASHDPALNARFERTADLHNGRWIENDVS